MDPTVRPEDKLTKYSLSKLEYHVTAGTHSRESQLKRALKADNVFPVVCPDCQLPFKSSRVFIKHIKEDHPEQLWEDFDDEDDEVEAEEGDDGEEDDDDEESAPYVGKGKGRA
jgi:hypothetical protein